MKLAVLDNALDEDNRRVVEEYFSSFAASTGQQWVDGDYKTIVTYASPLSNILMQVATVFDLSDMVGCEYWSNYNGKSGWHKDTDEHALYKLGVEKFPICSVVYYPKVDVRIGGDLVFESVRVTPITNRLIVFGPDLLHSVENFIGNRISVAVNPWAYKLEPVCR